MEIIQRSLIAFVDVHIICFFLITSNDTFNSTLLIAFRAIWHYHLKPVLPAQGHKPTMSIKAHRYASTLFLIVSHGNGLAELRQRDTERYRRPFVSQGRYKKKPPGNFPRRLDKCQIRRGYYGDQKYRSIPGESGTEIIRFFRNLT